MGQGIGGNPAADNATIEYDSQAKLRIKDDGVDAAKLKDDATTDANRAVTTNHIRDSAVTTAKIADDAVDAAKLKDDATTDANRAVTTNHIRDSAVTEAKIGTAAVTEAKIGAAAVAQGKLKTATGEVSKGNGWGHLTLPGGQYGFYPQVRGDVASPTVGAMIFNSGIANISTSYITTVSLSGDGATAIYAQQRYVTASGQDHWVFLLIDKLTGDILAGYSAPDHPMYGNGGDINLVPHPFRAMDLTGKEVVILGKADIAALKAKVTKEDSILTIVHRDHKIEVAQELPYQPLHTGKFIDEQPVLLDTLPSGIVVRGLKNKV